MRLTAGHKTYIFSTTTHTLHAHTYTHFETHNKKRKRTLAREENKKARGSEENKKKNTCMHTSRWCIDVMLGIFPRREKKKRYKNIPISILFFFVLLIL